MEEKLFRIWHGDSNDRDELGRATAQDIDEVIEYVKTQYLKPDTEFYDIDYQGDDQVYLMIDMCKACDLSTLHKPLQYNPCENCERSEYIEITQDLDAEPEYKTIYGVNEYADLTTDTRPISYNTRLKEAWEHSPRRGVSALILQTIEDNPHLEQGFSKELIAKSKEDLDL